MPNGDPHLPLLTTEQIQKCLEENKDLILAIMELQSLGKFAETAQYQAKLQHNLTFLAKLADAGPQEQMYSQGQGIQQPRVTMSQQPLDMNEQQQQQQQHMAMSLQQQQQQQHMAMSLQQPDLTTSKLPFQLNEQQLQQYHRLPAFFQQHQLIPEAMMGNIHGTPTNSGMQTRLFNLPDTPSINLMGSDVGPGWS